MAMSNWLEDCFNRIKGGGCKALIVKECPKNCSSYINDPEQYIEMLEHLMYYNRYNKNLLAEYRKEIRSIRIKHNLPIPETDNIVSESAYIGWLEIYHESLKRRGKGGGSSEGASSPTPRKNDNRVVGTTMNSVEKEEYNRLLQEWEEKHGRLEKLSRSSMSNSKVDSYTGELIK